MAWILQDIRVGTSQIGRVDEDATVKVGTEMPAYSPVLDEYDDFIYLQGVAGTTVGARVVYDELSFSTILSAVGAGGRVATAMAAVGEGQYGWYRKRFVEPRVQSFYDRDSVVQAFTDGQEFETGTVLKAGATEWIVDNTSTIILDMPGTVPADRYTPQHFGAYGAYKTRTDYVLIGYLLSDRFATLAAAQAVYPDATALTETIDSHAFQRCADAVKAIVAVTSSGPWTSWNKDAPSRIFWMPRGYYVINRTVDFTGMGSNEPWSLKGDGAVIFNQCVGETGFDLIASGQCSMDGWKMINDLIRGVGCPRTGMLWGRDSTGSGSAGHKIGRIDIEGFATLAAIQNYAGESHEFDYLVLRNSLNPNLSMMDYASATATPAANDTVSWTGGTGRITNVSTSDSILSIELLTGVAVTNGQTITYQTSQTATVSSVYTQPSGEGPGGWSYCMVQDGSNYWGTDSQYVTNASSPDPASFTINMGRISCLHNGLGDGLWISDAVNHWYRGYFTSSTDGGAGICVFTPDGGASQTLNCVHFHCSIESDGGDTDPDTGLYCLVRFDAESASSTVGVYDFRLTTHKPGAGYGVFHAESNVDLVNHVGEISTTIVSAAASSAMWSDASKFAFHGVIRDLNSTTGFLNIDDLADGSGIIFTRGGISATCPHPFFIFDENNVAVNHNMRLIDDGSGFGGRITSVDPSGTTLGVMEFLDPGVRFDPDGGGSYHQLGSSAYYWSGTAGDMDLGLNTKPFGTLFLDTQVKVNDIKVLGTQQAAIADSGGGDEQAKINAILAALRAHGIIAT